MRTAAILPVKRFTRAKQRLGISVAETLRGELAQAMVADVLDALRDTPSIERTIVVTRESEMVEDARSLGALVVADVEESGQSAAVTLGLLHAQEEGFERALCIPGDCPALDPRELEELLADGGDGDDDGGGEDAPSVTIVPDRHGTGTNGLLLSPVGVIVPAFGPGSFERHRALARAAGVLCRVERPGSLLLDIDTGSDLAALRERLTGLAGASGVAAGRAARTRVVLDRAANTTEPTLSSSNR
jgi:2-phospho-L-lactate guanylyltransferase